MFADNLKDFWEHGDFSYVMAFIQKLDPAELIVQPHIFIPLAILIGLLAHPATSYLGQKMLMWMIPLTWIGVTIVVLRNDIISNIGPFILALVSFFIIVFYIIYSQLMAND